MMKQVLSALFASLSICIAGLLVGCTGPEGPAGTAGTNGTDGIDANQSCIQCHTSSQVIASKVYQWETTLHSNGETWEAEGSNGTCIKCHNGAAFVFPLANAADSAEVMNNPTNANCYTCHQIHKTYSDSDWALTTVAPVTAIINSAITFDFGKGNICANCHQPRTMPVADVIAGRSTSASMVGTDSIKFTAKAARISGHYGAQVAVLAGVGAWIGSGWPAYAGENSHADNVADGCVQCHMSNQQHSFEPKVAACVDCHAGAKSFDIDSTQTKFTVLATELIDTLISRGIAKVDSAYPIGYSFNGASKTFPIAVVGAYTNWQLVMWDGSRGVHNSAYATYLLEQSLAAVK